ncbi:hypothetical protein [Paenibacillus sp. LK1]|uniref:hypothetical protein n=1 Tax=Paenibacillus sp. LK1 TaxID=2053014 RepID=UPI000C1A7A43|nr:hypothetical protein [Paenibacillus sp. LK1]PIH59108.1 hypothetical protein CS562_14305 [Paenibacillus sp. LK1]
MDHIIVQRKEGKKINDEAEWLKIVDIKSSSKELINGKKEYKTVFHTDGGDFIYCTSNDAIMHLMHKHHGLVVVDRGRMGNLYHAEHIDYEKGKMFFDVQANDYIEIIGDSRKSVVKEYFKKLFGKK